LSQPSYHLELLIAGFGTLLAGLIGAFAIWDMSWFPWNVVTAENSNILVAFVLLPLIYTTGIVTDRFIDLLLGRWFIPKINSRYFKDDRDAYLKARTYIYVKSESLKSVFEYSRMRIRILRCWMLNSFLIGIAALIFIASPPNPIEGAPDAAFCKFVCENSVSLTFTVILSTAFSVVVTFRSWYSMTDAECRNLKFQSAYLAEIGGK
jgi:hypothetical protein